MESQAHINQLQQKILLLPISELIKESLYPDAEIKIKDIIPITSSILSPFLEAKKNNKLYESIIHKWWHYFSPLIQEMLGSYGYLAKASAYSRRIINTTKKNLDFLSGLTVEQKNQLSGSLIKKKFASLREITTGFKENLITQELTEQPTKVSLTRYVNHILSAGIPIILSMYFFLNYILKSLLVIGVVAAVVALVRNNQQYIKLERRHGIEDIILTNYFITDKLLKSVKVLLDVKLDTQESRQKRKKKNSNSIIPDSSKNQNETVEQEMSLDNISTYDFTLKEAKIKKIKLEIRKQQTDKKNYILDKLAQESDIKSITWQGENTTYIYKPLKQKPVVISLWSEDQYLKAFCKIILYYVKEPL